MKQIAALLVVGLVAGLGIGSVRAAESTSPSSSLVISSVYFGSSSDASDEYVIVHNQSGEVINLKGYELDYKAAVGKSWYKKR